MAYLKLFSELEREKAIRVNDGKFIIDFIFEKILKIEVGNLIDSKQKRNSEIQENKALYIYTLYTLLNLPINEIIALCKLKTRKSFYDKYNFVNEQIKMQARHKTPVFKKLEIIKEAYQNGK